MSTNQKWSNLGDQYKHTVQDAIHTGDFSKLNKLVSDTLSDAVAEAGWQVKQASQTIQKETQNYRQENIQREYRRQQPYWQPPTKKLLPISKTKKVGSVSGILYTVFGSIGTGGSLIALFIGWIFFMIGLGWGVFTYSLLFLLLILFICMIRKGVVEQRRLSRMKRYIALFDDNMYMNIEDLAKQTHKSISYVQKDIVKMLQLGFFPEGHLDEKGTCLMLDDATYRQYLQIEKERKRLAIEEAANSKPQKSAESTVSEPANPELLTMIKEGQEYIQKLHYLNDIIEDESISEKMDRTENLLKEIFKRVEETAEQIPKMHKMMNYYLPTTIKLLQAYSEYDDISSPSEDIILAKAEIEKTVDTINEAFAELLNKLFQTSVFDVTTDAQVLQTMLAKEGLTKNNFTEETK